MRYRPDARTWAIAGGALAALLVIAAVRSRPATEVIAPAAVVAEFCPSDVRLLDRHGEPIHSLRLDKTRRRLAWTRLDETSPALVEAILASEDRRFFAHHGVEWRALGAAALQRVRGGPRRGGSTISMQLAALLDPSLRRRGTRSLGEKWRQMRGAWALERTWSKEQILEAYLNLITFRGEVQGVGAAAWLFYGKAPHGLTQAEAAVLAGLVRAPNAGQATLTRRAKQVMRAAFPSSRDAGVSETGHRGREVSAAVARLVAAPPGGTAGVALAPHAARRLLRAGCVDAKSTLDVATQRIAAESLQRHLLALRDRNVRDAAVLVVDNDSGEVLAYVGASGALSGARHVDGIQARRQAGSTLKPLLYGLAFDRRVLTAATLLDDSPLEIPVATGLFRPRNYDQRFRGPVTVREALAGSLNVPAVRALQLIGPDMFAAQLRGLGFGGLDRAGDYYGPALALGGADVSLWELVNAYRTLANGGVSTPLALERPAQVAAAPAAATTADRAGTSPATTRGNQRKVFSPAAAFLVADVLSDRESRAATFGFESPLSTRFWSAVKTGTSKDMRDNWCVGFSRRYTVGVWVGNFSGAPMHDVSGVSGAAPIWAEVMGWLHRAEPSAAPVAPRGVTRIEGEWFVDGTAPVRPARVASASASASASAPASVTAAQIVTPVDGTIIALDPDIDDDRERIAFIASAGAGLRWRLGDTDLGPADVSVIWEPKPGSYALSLIEPSGTTVASTTFEVRGGG